MQTFRFDQSKYGSVVAALVAEPRLAELGPGSPEPGVHVALRRFNPASDLEKPIRDREAARACHAGLWLYFDYLDESHTISQEVNTAEGSYWHAIMHRREPDASNSKYWWRMVGNHPLFPVLSEQCAILGYTFTTPDSFVDFCERVRGSGTDLERTARQVQLLEWQMLFDWCYRKAVGD
jgi:hypothetical protein